MSESLNRKVKTATKWATIGEIAAKLVTPISSVVLARLLTPEAFAVVTTLAMIISFAEIFTDAGFQKYLVQHEFIDDKDRDESTNVAFWSNLAMSLFLWFIITAFSGPLAALVGNPGLGHVLVIACVSIPFAAFSSIQMALFKRDLDFKTLAKVRIISTFIPLVITVPLAFWMRSYWALVIGTIIVNLVNAVLLTIYSKWKPRRFYSLTKLKGMFSFTVWSMVEAISIWLTSYVDVFIVGTMLSQYYLGLYKTSSTLVGQIMALITSITTPILFSALSRLQDNDREFKQLFFKFQKLVGILIIPMGAGIYVFSDLITKLLLGNQWLEASGFIGLWGLTGAITIVFSHYASEVYRSKGKPRLSVLAQWLHIIALWPAVLIAVKYGFEVLYIVRSLVRFEGIFVHAIIMLIFIGISFGQMLKNVMPSIIATFIMVLMGIIMKENMPTNVCWQLAEIIVCSLIYWGVIIIFKEERELIKSFILKRSF